MRDIKIKRVFNMKMANQLIQRGHVLIRTTSDRIYKGRIVYIFEMNNDFIKDFEELKK